MELTVRGGHLEALHVLLQHGAFDDVIDDNIGANRLAGSVLQEREGTQPAFGPAFVVSFSNVVASLICDGAPGRVLELE